MKKSEEVFGISPTEQKEYFVALASSMEDCELQEKISELKKVIKQKTSEIEKFGETILEMKDLKGSNMAFKYMRLVDSLENVRKTLRIFKDELAKRKEADEERYY